MEPDRGKGRESAGEDPAEPMLNVPQPNRRPSLPDISSQAGPVPQTGSTMPLSQQQRSHSMSSQHPLHPLQGQPMRMLSPEQAAYYQYQMQQFQHQQQQNLEHVQRHLQEEQLRRVSPPSRTGHQTLALGRPPPRKGGTLEPTAPHDSVPRPAHQGREEPQDTEHDAEDSSGELSDGAFTSASAGSSPRKRLRSDSFDSTGSIDSVAAPACFAASSAADGKDGTAERPRHDPTGPRLRSTHQCEQCGKIYKHRNCLSKHLWEHHESWEQTKKICSTKHQQVQLLEAAQVLMEMQLLPPMQPGASPYPMASVMGPMPGMDGGQANGLYPAVQYYHPPRS